MVRSQNSLQFSTNMDYQISRASFETGALTPREHFADRKMSIEIVFEELHLVVSKKIAFEYRENTLPNATNKIDNFFILKPSKYR